LARSRLFSFSVHRPGSDRSNRSRADDRCRHISSLKYRPGELLGIKTCVGFARLEGDPNNLFSHVLKFDFVCPA
jgi:hypothetical protein